MESDHNTLVLELDWKDNKENRYKRETILDFKNKDNNFQKYIDMTTNNKDLESCFKADLSLDILTKRWLRIFKNILHTCFAVVRLKKKKVDKELKKLFEKKEKLVEDISRHRSYNKNYEEI